MATSRSFIQTSEPPPLRYRTPSPPRRAVEPISPNHSQRIWQIPNTSDASDLGHLYDNWHSIDEFKQKAREDNGGLRTIGEGQSRAGTMRHGRSGSNIDTLATIALATSPTFASPQPPMNAIGLDLIQNGNAQNNDHCTTERPSKRAKSEKLPSPVLHRTSMSERPATSHVLSFESMREDVELLLNFARPDNFVSFHNRSRAGSMTADKLRNSPTDVKWNSSANGSEERSSSVKVSSTTTYNGLSLPSDPADPNLSHGEEIQHALEVKSRSLELSHPRSLDTEKSQPTVDCIQPPSLVDSTEGSHDAATTADSDTGKDLGAFPGQKLGDSQTHDMATATCAACDSAWIDENSVDPSGATSWIRCDACKRWFHFACAGFRDEKEVENIDKFSCKDCELTHGPTTYVRKSARARTAIDYAGLNQGVVKSAVDGPEHHYIQPIKDGKIKFLPENFARMRPELVTAEYFERGSGMTEPVVIPAWLNPGRSDSDSDEAHLEDTYIDYPDSLTDTSWEEDDEYDENPDCGQDALGMVIPKYLTVRMVAELYGPDEKVEVIDVKSQQGGEKGWTMRRWADYYEEDTEPKVIRNVISLEVSQTKLGRLIRRPKIVRDLDLQDSVWPDELKAIGDYPKVQFYCLMSVADCYTDFHIDFGGSSVFYHILRGKKTFFFIPPKERYLKKYEEWCNSADQDTTFLGDETKECYRVDLSAGDTMLIPAGWIHAVWTPENSLVIGGNFLTRLHYGMQIKVAKIEKDTKVARKFRYPHFQKILWYTAIKYIEDDPIPPLVLQAFHSDENYRFYRKEPSHYEFGERANMAEAGSDLFNARYYAQAELDGLPDLAKYLVRTALIAQELLTEGISVETRKAVKRSIPKGHGDSLDIVKTFGVWLAWKRGNEKAATWAHPDMFPSSVKADSKWTRQPERCTDKTTFSDPPRAPTGRQSSRKQPPAAADDQPDKSPPPTDSETLSTRAAFPSTPKTSGLGPKRVACDACRKRRIRCRHKDELSTMERDSKNTNVPSPETKVEITSKPGVQSGSKVVESVPKDVVTTPPAPHDISSLDGQASVNSPNLFSKKGRSKACDECRKSKRRCIHDEFGRVDPIKAQEPSKPRAAGTNKRPRTSNEGANEPSPKRPKEELKEQDEFPAPLLDGLQDAVQDHVRDLSAEFLDSIDRHISPITPNREGSYDDNLPELVPSPARHVTLRDDHTVQLAKAATALEALRPPDDLTRGFAVSRAESSQDETVIGGHFPSDRRPDAGVPQEPARFPLSISFSFPAEKSAAITTNPKPVGLLASPPNSNEDDVGVSPTASDNIAGELDIGHELHTPKSSSRHSSRQPKHLDRHVPEPLSNSTKVMSTPRRASSSTNGSTHATQESASHHLSTCRRPSSSHRASSVLSLKTSPALTSISGKSTSPVMDGRTLSKTPSKPARASLGEIDADPESLKLIRELQEQDFGLRRRGTKVA